MTRTILSLRIALQPFLGERKDNERVSCMDIRLTGVDEDRIVTEVGRRAALGLRDVVVDENSAGRSDVDFTGPVLDRLAPSRIALRSGSQSAGDGPKRSPRVVSASLRIQSHRD